MRRVIITRHNAAIEFIRTQLPEFATAPVIVDARVEDVVNASVAGNVPFHLATAAREVYAILFTKNPPRGREFSLKDMTDAGAYIKRFYVMDANTVDTVAGVQYNSTNNQGE